MPSYINPDKLSLNKYYQNNDPDCINSLCKDYEDAISHRYVIRRVSPQNRHWWHGFRDRESLIKFILASQGLASSVAALLLRVASRDIPDLLAKSMFMPSRQCYKTENP